MRRRIAVRRSAFLAGVSSFALASCSRAVTNRLEPDVGVTVVGDYLALGLGAADPRDAFVYGAVVKAVNRRLRYLESFAMFDGSIRDVADVQALQISPDAHIVIVVAGSNDLASGTPPTVFADDYAAALRRIDTRAAKSVLLCCGLPDLALLGDRLTDRYVEPLVVEGAFDDAIKALCRKHGGTFVKLSGVIGAASRGNDVYFSADRARPTSLGYALLTPRLEEAVRTAVAALDRRKKNAAR